MLKENPIGFLQRPESGISLGQGIHATEVFRRAMDVGVAGAFFKLPDDYDFLVQRPSGVEWQDDVAEKPSTIGVRLAAGGYLISPWAEGI